MARHDPLPERGFSVDTITDDSGFLSLAAEWNEAVDRAGMAHPFLRHEWLRTWWECFGGGRRLHVLVVRAGTRIVAIAPLVWERARMYGVPVRRLRLMHNDHTPHADFIVTEQPHRAYRALWDALRTTRDRWDVLQLGELPAESATHDLLTRLATADGCATGVWPSDDSPYLELHGSWDTYLASLSPKFRQNLRNRLVRLTRLGVPTLKVETTAIPSVCEEAVRLEASGWKRAEGTAIGSDPAVHRFYRLFAERAAERGWLRLLFLTVNGCSVATAYALCYQRRLSLVKTGYDPTYATCSPFKLLTYFAVRQAYADGLTEFDFLGDTEPWKREWTTTSRRHDWLFIFARTGRGRLLYRAKFQLLPALKRSRLARCLRDHRFQLSASSSQPELKADS